MAEISAKSPDATMYEESEAAVTGGGRGAAVRGGTGMPEGGVGDVVGGAVPGAKLEKRVSTGGTAWVPAAGVGRAAGGAMLKLPVGVFFGAAGATGGMEGTTLLAEMGATGGMAAVTLGRG